MQSNIIIFRPNRERLSSEEFIAGMGEGCVRVSNSDLRGLRMVTHYQIADEDVEQTLRVAAEVMESRVRVSA